MIVVMAGAAAVLLGIAIGVIAVIVVAIRREDTGELGVTAPGRLTKMTRRATGLHVTRSDPRYQVSVHFNATFAGEAEQPESVAL